MEPFSVVIAGGGVAALEALLRLHRLAGDRVAITVLAPNDDFVYRALSVGQPFSLGAAERHPLAPIIEHANAHWVTDTLASVELKRGLLHTGGGAEISFDALLVAVGAQTRPAFEHVRSFDDARADELFRGVVQDVEEGYAKRIAFINPAGPVWPLPLYELAFMTAGKGYDAGLDDLQLDLITAEPQPLPAFGAEVSAAVGELLEQAGIRLHTSEEPVVTASGRVTLPAEGTELEVDSMVAMPRLVGPSIGGIPGVGRGFIPIDRHCAVPDTGNRIFVAGDAADFPLKHGGVGAQAADVAAAAIARQAGADVDVPDFRPVVQGKLMTGAGPKFLSANYVGGQGFNSVIADEPIGTGSSEKVTAAELGPYLARVQARA